jgi:DNA polymerase-1
MDKIKKTDHFYLIDGSGYIFRAYYALPPLTRKSDGLPVGAVSGFCSMLFKLLQDSRSDDNLQKPTHFAVIFDSAKTLEMKFILIIKLIDQKHLMILFPNLNI